jgi:hypothetical protein
VTFVQSLLDPTSRATDARNTMNQMRAAMLPEIAHPYASKMPATMNNDLLEYVSAKLRYERGDTSLGSRCSRATRR